MRMKCQKKRCEYEGEFPETFDSDIECPLCGSIMIKVDEKLSPIEDNMKHCIKWYGMEQVFSEIDKVANPLTRCEHRKIFWGLIAKMGLKFRTELPKEQ